MLKKVKKKPDPKELLRKSYTDTIHESLEEKGVSFFQPGKSLNINTSYLELPEDITEVPGKELGKLLNAYTQQKMYMRTLIGWTGCYIEEAGRKYMEASMPFYRDLSSQKISEKAKDTLVNNEPDVLPYYNRLSDFRMKKTLLENNLLSIEDAIFLISREISRRESDFNNDTRNYNISKR